MDVSPQQYQGLMHVAAASDNSRHGQDWHLDADDTLLADGSVAVIVCDGVSSCVDSALISQAVGTAVAGFFAERAVSTGDLSTAPWQKRAFHAAQVAAAREDCDGATTLLALRIRLPDALGEPVLLQGLAVGNGSIIELAVQADPPHRIVGWTDHVVPHVTYLDHGDDVLTGYLSPQHRSPESSSFEFQVVSNAWRVLLVCSDGLSTLEGLSEGPTADGRNWRLVPAPLKCLIDGLERTLPVVLDPTTSYDDGVRILRTALDNSLRSADEQGLLFDDATAAVVLVPPSVALDESSALPEDVTGGSTEREGP